MCVLELGSWRGSCLGSSRPGEMQESFASVTRRAERSVVEVDDSEETWFVGYVPKR